jgi:hypothetical protein
MKSCYLLNDPQANSSKLMGFVGGRDHLLVLFYAAGWSVWSFDFRQGRKPCLRVLECDKSACADLDGAQAPESDFIPGCGAPDAGPSGEGIDRHRAAIQGVSVLSIQSSTSTSPTKGHGHIESSSLMIQAL